MRIFYVIRIAKYKLERTASVNTCQIVGASKDKLVLFFTYTAMGSTEEPQGVYFRIYHDE